MSALTPRGSTRAWRRLRAFVLRRDGFRCQMQVAASGRHVEDDDPAAARRCNAYAGHVDHIVERRNADPAGFVELPSGARVPVDSPANLRASCATGNLGRRPGRRPSSSSQRRESARSWTP